MKFDAYRLRQKRRIPARYVTYSHLSDDKFHSQNIGLGSSTPHRRRLLGDEGDASPTFQPEGDSIGNILTHFQFIKQMDKHIARLITPLS